MGEGPDAEGSVNTEGCTDAKSTERYIVGKRRSYNGKQRAKVEEIKKKMHSEKNPAKGKKKNRSGEAR